ncbi:MAG: zinc ribbon domain-containing protein [Candidatus Methanosuratus sp.]|nr:zinc ribbon domain-containing protein [Candidatus Methanosuratincola sp.]
MRKATPASASVKVKHPEVEVKPPAEARINRCIKCGAEARGGNKFCTKCGAPLNNRTMLKRRTGITSAFIEPRECRVRKARMDESRLLFLPLTTAAPLGTFGALLRYHRSPSSSKPTVNKCRCPDKPLLGIIATTASCDASMLSKNLTKSFISLSKSMMLK